MRFTSRLTFHVLQTQQSDITSQGWLFSAVVIFLGNVCVLLFGLPLLTAKVGMLNSLGLVVRKHRHDLPLAATGDLRF